MRRKNRSIFPDWSILPALLLLFSGCGAVVSSAQVVVAHVAPAWGYRYHPGYAMVDCDLDPEEALVILDGRELGEADDYDGFPSYLFIRPGAHVLEFRAQGRQPLVVSGAFSSGAFIRVDRELEPGSTPILVELDPGEDSGQEEEPRHEPPPVLPPDDGPAGPTAVRTPIEEERGRETRAATAAGYLSLTIVPGDAAVYIDDRFIGTGDEIPRLHGALRLETGDHTIQVIRPGYVNRILPLHVIGEEHQQLDVRLEKTAAD
jgi:hypothetical protein